MMRVLRFIAFVGAVGVLISSSAAAAVPPARNLIRALPASSPAHSACNADLVRGLNVGGPVSIVLVKKFNKGDRVTLPDVNPKVVETADDDLCLVKIIVGPGVAGPANEWSTTKGMGIEIWLPSRARWQGRSFNFFRGGWNGDPDIASATSFSDQGTASGYSYRTPLSYANDTGFATGATDGGNPPPLKAEFKEGRGMTFMLPDGTINKLAWRNYVSGATHAMALSIKSISQRYYGKSPRYNYLTGCSSGGRAVYASAQDYPGDFEGVLAVCPSITQSHLHLSLLYPQLVMQRDLGGKVLTHGQADLVSQAAINACDTTVNGQHDGYITDFERCTYDPTKDKVVLCHQSGGTAPAENCLTVAEATAVNKIWYGPTRDGSVPPPEFDNGTSIYRSPDHLWWGIHRGSRLWSAPPGEGVLDSVNGVPVPFDLPMDQLALSTESSYLMPPQWKVGNFVGANGWKDMSYANLADAMDRGRALQPWYGNIDSDDPDLRTFAAQGHKLLTIHGGADQYISSASPINYFVRVSTIVGGVAEANKFHRLFIVPGMGHCGGYGTYNDAAAPLVPFDEALNALIAWVERNQARSQLLAETSLDAPVHRTRPVCMYPNQIRYSSGDVNKAESYSCEKL